MHADTVCVVWINVSTPFIGLDSCWLMCFTTQHNITLQVLNWCSTQNGHILVKLWVVGAYWVSEGEQDVQVAPVDIWIIWELIVTNVIQADHSCWSSYWSNLRWVSVWYWTDRIWVEYHFKVGMVAVTSVSSCLNLVLKNNCSLSQCGSYSCSFGHHLYEVWQHTHCTVKDCWDLGMWQHCYNKVRQGSNTSIQLIRQVGNKPQVSQACCMVLETLLVDDD